MIDLAIVGAALVALGLATLWVGCMLGQPYYGDDNEPDKNE